MENGFSVDLPWKRLAPLQFPHHYRFPRHSLPHRRPLPLRPQILHLRFHPPHFPHRCPQPLSLLPLLHPLLLPSLLSWPIPPCSVLAPWQPSGCLI